MSGTTQKQTAASARALADARSVFDHGIPVLLGVRALEVGPDRVTAELRIRPEHINRGGRVGGGVLMAMADVMGAAGSVAHRPPGFRGGTIESKTNFFAAAKGPMLHAVCIPLHVGRTTSVWQTTITDSSGRAVAMVVQTQVALPAAGD